MLSSDNAMVVGHAHMRRRERREATKLAVMTSIDVWDEEDAERYDEISAEMFEPHVLDPAVDFLAEPIWLRRAPQSVCSPAAASARRRQTLHRHWLRVAVARH